MRRLYHSRVTSTHGVYTRKSTASPQINIANLVQSLLRQVEHFKGGSRSRFPKLVRQFLVLIFYCDCTCYSRDFIYTTEWTITALTVTITCSIRFFSARRCVYARPMSSCGVYPSVCLSRSCILSKRINIFAIFCHYRVATPF